jgi:carboxypeptidase Q
LKRANEWTRDQFTAMGCSNAHSEDWGEFGRGWEQLNTWVRMIAPDKAIFIAQAAPWSPSTTGAIRGSASWADIQEQKDFEKYKGKLAGKILFLGEMREVKLVDKPLTTRYDDAELAKLQEYPIRLPNDPDARQRFLRQSEFREKLG